MRFITLILAYALFFSACGGGVVHVTSSRGRDTVVHTPAGDVHVDSLKYCPPHQSKPCGT